MSRNVVKDVNVGSMDVELHQGDLITVGMTHEIKVGRDTSWIRYEVSTRVRPEETVEDARTRAVGHVNESVMFAVEAAVEAVRSKS